MTQKRTPPFPAEVRERAVRMVLEQGGEHPTQWAAITSVAGKIGCTGETLRNWCAKPNETGACVLG
jgi:transposase-like protein